MPLRQKSVKEKWAMDYLLTIAVYSQQKSDEQSRQENAQEDSASADSESECCHESIHR